MRLPHTRRLPTRGRVLTVVGSLLALLAVLTVTGCAADPDPSPPAGVDLLDVPTPSPDPDDFVAEVDNPWFPLEPGATWSFEGAATASVTAEVLGEPGEVAGVTTTVVTSTTGSETVTDHYAQDDAGNVWWFAREGVWEAGEDGAQAGLLMAATPRYGDGYRTAYRPGVVEQRAEVLAADDDQVVLQLVDPVDGDARLLVTYERGVGPTRVESSAGVLRRADDG